MLPSLMHTAVVSTRRERLRAATVAEIKEAALAQIAEVGGPGLSLRGVARSIGMSPAGLYRYYEGRDGLLTELITDAYNALADAVAEGVATSGEEPRGRFAGGIRAYRRWSLENPNQFLLIFGTPIPGYTAPEDGPTVAANRRMGQQFFMIGLEAWQRGTFRPPAGSPAPTSGEKELAELLDPEFPPELVPVMLGTWAHFHGLITLEVLNQLDWIYRDDAETFFNCEIERLLDSLALEG
jgi:AcrR family transcriptional regulator